VGIYSVCVVVLYNQTEMESGSTALFDVIGLGTHETVFNKNDFVRLTVVSPA